MRFWGVVLALTLAAVAAEAQETAETFAYEVEEGDTCVKISERFFGDRNRYDLIHVHNPGMGPPPHDLQPGTILRLPKQAQDADELPDAHVTDVRRDVQAAEPTGAEWRRAERGLGLFGGWRVNTLERSAAELTFRDTSVIQMRQNTLVVIFGATAGRARRQTSRAELRNGTLRSRLGTLRMEVAMPAGRAELAGGSTVVDVDEEETTRVSHHEGNPVSLEGSEGGRVRVPAGRGSKVARRGRPTPPRPLPAAPTWGDSPTAFVGIAGDGARVHGAWASVEEAAVYRVEILSGTTVFAAVEVPAAVTRFELRGVPAGEYAVRVSTIDGDSFESAPSEPLAITVSLLDVRSPGADSVDERPLPDPSQEARDPEVAVGSELVTPAGVECREGQGGPVVGRLAQSGSVTLVCRAGEQAIEPLTVSVVGAASPESTAPSAPARERAAAPEVAAELPPERPPTPPHRPHRQIALATWRHPTVLALRDPDPVAPVRASVALGLTHDQDDNGAAVGLLGDLALGRHLRLQLGYAHGLSERDPVLPRFYSGLGAVVLRGAVPLRVEMAAWWPTTPGGSVVLAPSIDVGFEAVERRLFVRTRQGALLDPGDDGSLTWASAYGVDAWLVGSLSLGLEVDAAIGRDRAADELLTRVALGLVATSELGPASISLAVQRSLTRDFERAIAPWRVQLTLGGAFFR